jgi:hypothetical protein
MSERIRVDDIPTREPDIDCEASGDYYAMRIWVEENVIAFRDADMRTAWNYYDEIECDNSINANGYLELLSKRHSHPHHDKVIDYLERILLGEPCDIPNN